VEEVAVDAVPVDLVAPCFVESSLGMVICLSEVVVEAVAILCEWAIESESVSRSVSGFFVLEEVLSLVAPGLASLFVLCEEAIVMSSSRSDLVGRSVSVFFVLGGVLFWGTVCFGFGNPFKRTSVSPLLYPLLDLEETVEADELEETVEADESVRDRTSSFLLPDFDFKMLEDSFFLLGKVVRVAVLDCGYKSDSASQSSTLLRSLRLFSHWLEVLSL
jgi:hypothetical protein